MKHLIYILTIIIFFGAVSELYCAAPEGITYQGTIRKDGAIHTGQINAMFRITSQDGATEYWTSGSTTVYASGGLFRYVLGTPNEAQFNAVPWSVITPYIETSIDGLTLPREKLFTTPYAFHAKSSELAVNGFEVIDGDIKLSSSTYSGGIIFPDGSYQATAAGTSLWTASGSDIYNTNIGNIGIGLTNPSEKLEVSGNIAANSFIGNGSALITLTAGNISAGSLGSNVIASSIAVNAVKDASIVTMTSSKLSGALPALDGSALFGVTANLIAAANIQDGALGANVITSSIAVAAINNENQIVDGTIVNADLAGSIAYSNLSLTGAILNADLDGSIADSKLNQITTTDKVAAGAIADGTLSSLVMTSSVAVNSVYDTSIVAMTSSKLSGALPALDGSALTNLTAANISGGSLGSGIITSSIAIGAINNENQIVDGTIVNADLDGSIAYNKLSLTGAILNADLDGSIADSKLNQITTTDKVAAGAIADGTLSSLVMTSSVAVNSVYDTSIVAMTSSKLSGALPALDGSALTDITAINIAAGTAGINISGNAATATNLAGGAANSVPYQTGSNTTIFVAAPGANSVLFANSGAPIWTNTPTITGTNFTDIPWTGISKIGSSLANLITRSAGDLSSGNLPIARMPVSGSWALTGNLGISGGNVGIGSASPPKPLHVKGTDEGISVSDDDTAKGEIYWDTANGMLVIKVQ